MMSGSLVDCHVHCNFSDDCTATAGLQAESAYKNNLYGIIFTDHYDSDYPNPQYHFEFNVKKRAEQLKLIQEEYKGRLKILIGIELGVQCDKAVLDKSKNLIKGGLFDCVINSVHAVSGFSLCSQTVFYEGKTKSQAFEEYLMAVYNSICQFNDFDIVGHIGYVSRYWPHEDKTMRYDDYHDICDMILKKIIDAGKALEVNTSGYRYGLGTTIPDLDMIKRYKDLKGELITIGSDAHSPEYVGNLLTVQRRCLSV